MNGPRGCCCRGMPHTRSHCLIIVYGSHNCLFFQKVQEGVKCNFLCSTCGAVTITVKCGPDTNEEVVPSYDFTRTLCNLHKNKMDYTWKNQEMNLWSVVFDWLASVLSEGVLTFYPQFPLDTSPLRCVSATPGEQIRFTLVYVLIPTRSVALHICSVPACDASCLLYCAVADSNCNQRGLSDGEAKPDRSRNAAYPYSVESLKGSNCGAGLRGAWEAGRDMKVYFHWIRVCCVTLCYDEALRMILSIENVKTVVLNV